MYRLVREPTGVCPVPLEDGPTDPEILDWFDRVRRHGLGRGEYRGKSAIIRWAATVAAGDDDLARVQSLLLRFAPEDDPSVTALDHGLLRARP